MSEFTSQLAAVQKNFGQADISSMGATVPIVHPTLVSPPSNSGTDPEQSVLNCNADYERIPYGWRPSALMGQCGFKIQAKEFYSPSSPCYPVQDLSCMGPVQKRAWAEICKTEFPCKPPELPKSVPSYQAPPGMFKQNRLESPTWEKGLQIAIQNAGLVLGTFGLSCILATCVGSRRNKDDPGSGQEADSDTQASSSSD
jgi:hypothetical protein